MMVILSHKDLRWLVTQQELTHAVHNSQFENRVLDLGVQNFWALGELLSG